MRVFAWIIEYRDHDNWLVKRIQWSMEQPVGIDALEFDVKHREDLFFDGNQLKVRG